MKNNNYAIRLEKILKKDKEFTRFLKKNKVFFLWVKNVLEYSYKGNLLSIVNIPRRSYISGTFIWHFTEMDIWNDIHNKWIEQTQWQ